MGRAGYLSIATWSRSTVAGSLRCAEMRKNLDTKELISRSGTILRQERCRLEAGGVNKWFPGIFTSNT